jgi:plasmid stabilization system protein ParE
MFHVVITAPAARDLQEQHDWWAANRSELQAARWYRGLSKAIKSLRSHPTRFALARESKRWPFEVRQLTFGLGRRPTHRAVFRIEGNDVLVLRARHLAQAKLDIGEIEL